MKGTVDITPLLLVLLSLALPMLSFVVLFVLKDKLKEKTRGVVASLLLFTSFLSALYCILYCGLSAEYAYNLDWFSYASKNTIVNISFSVLLNGMTLLMLNVALFISLLVHLYSMEYMHHKKNHAVYFPYLGLFTASMVLLVISNNILITFMAWELVGFASYLLVGFWFSKEAAAKAATKAFLMNRVADMFFLVALLLLFIHVGSFDLEIIHSQYLASQVSSEYVFWIGFLFFIGCMAKTAQFPLNSWLPDAMEGPTPVSALLHAATMVAAGVFLLVKMEYLLDEHVRLLMAVVGGLTAFFGAIPALTSFDSKKILAFSTVSQLGYMIAAIGCSEPGAAYFHLITHAFFKAGLFLSVGVVIHALHEVQVNLVKEKCFTYFNTMDLRAMGGLGKRLPFVMIAYLLTAASLIGLPFFSGFLSKESILNAMVGMALKYEGVFWIVPVLGILTVLLTAYYITRQGLLIFYGESRLTKLDGYVENAWKGIKVNVLVFTVPLGLLSFASLFILFSWNPFSAHHAWIYSLSGLLKSTGNEHLFVALCSLSAILVGMLWSYYNNKGGLKKSHETLLSTIGTNFYYLDKVTESFVISPLLYTSAFIAKFDKQGIDRSIHFIVYATVLKAQIIAWFDKTFVDGVITTAVYVTGRIGKAFRVFQKGNVQNNLFWVFVVLLLMAVWIIIQMLR